VIPKSNKKERIQENAAVGGFNLSEEEIASITELHKIGNKLDWDPKDEP